MRKIISLSLAVAFAITAFSAVPAAAASDVTTSDAGLQCQLPGVDIHGRMIFGGFGDIKKVVENDRHALMTCKGTDITNRSGREHQFDGICMIPLADGTWVQADAQVTLNKNGNATMKCKASFEVETIAQEKRAAK